MKNYKNRKNANVKYSDLKIRNVILQHKQFPAEA